MATATNDMHTGDPAVRYISQVGTVSVGVVSGDKGTGKSAMVKDVAKQSGRKLLTLNGSTVDFTDFAGLPSQNALPEWQNHITKENSVLFVDDFSSASFGFREAMLELVLENELPNGTEIPQSSLIVFSVSPNDILLDENLG